MANDESKCACQRCGQSIAFPTVMHGQDVACPHCTRETTLQVPIPLPPEARVRKAEASIPTITVTNLPAPVSENTVVCAYALAALMPFICFLMGIYLMTQKRSGSGLACIGLSLICALIWLALLNQ